MDKKKLTLPDIIQALRDKRKQIDEMKARHAEELKPLQEWDIQMTAKLLDYLRTSGQEMIRTANGTIYKATKTRYKVHDLAAFQQHVITTQDWGLIVWRANETNSESYFAAHNSTIVPGLERTPEATLHVRAPAKPKVKGNSGQSHDSEPASEQVESL